MYVISNDCQSKTSKQHLTDRVHLARSQIGKTSAKVAHRQVGCSGWISHDKAIVYKCHLLPGTNWLKPCWNSTVKAIGS